MNACRLCWHRHGCKSAESPPDGGTIEPTACRGGEKWAAGSSVQVGVNRLRSPRGERDGGPFAALPCDPQHAVRAFYVQVRRVGTQCFRDPQPVESKQENQSVSPQTVIACGRDEQCQLVTVKPR